MLEYDEEREVLRRLYLSHESVNEIAYHLNYVVQTVYNTKSLAVKKLEAKLAEVGDV